MFSIKALILYVLFFVIGWLLARWLWNKKQSEIEQTHSYSPSDNANTRSASAAGSDAANVDNSTSDAATSSIAENIDEDIAPTSKDAAAAAPVSKSTPVKAAVKEKRKKTVETPHTPAASLVTSSTDTASSDSDSLEEKAPETSTPELLDGPRDGEADDLKRIKGVGKKIEEKLNGFGVYHFDQIANWTDDQVKWIGGELAFAGRIERENWIEQAKVLASGGDTEFSRRVDKGKVSSSKA